MKKIINLLILTIASYCSFSQTAEDYNKAGYVKNQLGDSKGAIIDYTKAIELDPNNSRTYYWRGEAKMNLEDYRGALADFNKTVELAPSWPLAWYERGRVKIALGQIDSGCLDFSRAGELGWDAYDEIKEHCK